MKIDEDGFAKDIDFIKAMIRFEIDEAVFGIAEARRHLIGVDPQAQAALAMFGEAQKLRRAQQEREDESARQRNALGQATTISWGAVCSCPNS